MSDYESKIKTMETRADELRAELSDLQDEIEAKTLALGADMLDRRDVERGLAELAKLQSRESILDSAINQAKDSLAVLRADLAEEQRQAAIAEYHELNQTAGEWMKGVLTQLIELQGGLDAFMEMWKQSNRVATPYSLPEGDNLRFISQARDMKAQIDSLLRRAEQSNLTGAIVAEIRKEYPIEKGMTQGEYLAQLWGEVPKVPKPDMRFLDNNLRRR